MNVTKVVIPAAGLGTRFLPWTKSAPKELLPLLNKPAIQWVVEEAIMSEIKHFSFVTSRTKNAISEHFDSSPDLEIFLKEKNKLELISSIQKIIQSADFTYIRQPEPLGLGHAIWMARHTIGKEYFGIILPDDIIIDKTPGLAQLIRIARQEKASVVAVQEVPAECVSSYGVISIKKQITPSLFHVGDLIEKPHPKEAPSNLAVIGRYVLSHKIFQGLEEVSSYGANNELQLTDGISQMMKNNEKVFAYKIQGTRYDIGNPIGWIKAIIGFALQDPLYAPHIRNFIADINSLDSFLYNKSKIISHSL